MSQSGVLLKHGVLNGNQVMVDYLDDKLRRLRRVLDRAARERVFDAVNE